MNDWIEHPWEREDREIREAFEKKDAEIERLTNNLRATEVERDAGDKVANNLRAEIERLESVINSTAYHDGISARTEIERLKVLLSRVAGALGDLERFSFYCYSARNEKFLELITELREAAK